METIYKQREYDGKWMALTKIRDEENEYSYTIDKTQYTYTPWKWIITGVYDYEIAFEAKWQPIVLK